MLTPHLPSPVIYSWHFLEYQSPTNRLPVSDWWSRLTVKNRTLAGLFLRKMLNSLTTSNRPEEGTFTKFKNRKNLWEARWKGEQRIQHRLLCDPLVQGSVTLLCGCTHKQKRYDPPNALQTAENRSAQLKAGKATTNEFIF